MNFKYHLDPSSRKFSCPGCHQKKLVRYIDAESRNYCDEHYGRCDREVKCGYHKTPEGNHCSKDIQLPQVKPPYFISKEIFQRTLSSYNQNNLFAYLACQFGETKARYLVALYKVGTSKYWEGATIFWQINSWGRIGQGKIMLFDQETGKRVKEPFPHISSVHKQLNRQDQKPDYCFFGEHLLRLFPSKPVAIVESEKTALIMAARDSSCLWIATGGLSQFTTKRMQVFKKSQILLYPDLGVYEKWNNKTNELNQLGFTIKTSTLLEERATTFDKTEGFDIADYFVNI